MGMNMDATEAHIKDATLHSVHDILIDQDPNSAIASATSFKDLDLGQDLLKGVYAYKFAKPSQIQAHAIPMILHNPPKHLIAQAQSGTGKTAAFSLAILNRLDISNPSCQAIVVAPSRELARQIAVVMQELAKFTQCTITQVIPEAEQRTSPYTGHVIIGTPGKLGDMIKRFVPGTLYGSTRRKFIDVSSVRMLIVDEADCMLDMQGLLQQTEFIKRLLPSETQLIFFSATWDDLVMQFANKFVEGKANRILLKTFQLSLTSVKQFYIDCDNENDRFKTLVALYGITTVAQSIIFVKERDVAERIASKMIEKGHHVSFLHGRLSPEGRDTVMDNFRAGRSKVLVTTNVLARGIDVDRVNMVINYDLPVGKDNIADPTTYLHRIGRTGRFGRSGISVNFVHSYDSYTVMNEIGDFYKCSIIKIPTELDHNDGASLQELEDARVDRMESFLKKQLKI
ncbi:RNA helicase required for poly(A+) mRNA export [Entomortierella beljakovae]|nr:RNA helicase required for poly(A+) mRNA export [Entomortierella beljakovae]